MQMNRAELRRRIARLDKYVTIVALLWLATSLLLILFAAPSRLHASAPATPGTNWSQIALGNPQPASSPGTV